MRHSCVLGLVIGGLLIGGLVIGGTASSAFANVRAPRTVAWLPSTAPRAATDALVVEYETLTFRCEGAACKARAAYRVRSSAALDIELRFVVPVKARVLARFGAASGTVSFVEAPALAADLDQKVPVIYPDADRPKIYEALVQGKVDIGLNELSFEYVQPLGAYETNYGYLKGEGDMIQQFAYGLWPLREWQRAPDFKLEFAVALQRPAPTWWQRTFGSTKEVMCWFGDRATMAPPKLPLRRTQRGDWYWLDALVSLPVIPETVQCSIGDDLDVD